MLKCSVLIFNALPPPTDLFYHSKTNGLQPSNDYLGFKMTKKSLKRLTDYIEYFVVVVCCAAVNDIIR